MSGKKYIIFWQWLTFFRPDASIPGVWKTAADWGAEGFGDYGVFVYLSALNKHAGDDGAMTSTSFSLRFLRFLRCPFSPFPPAPSCYLYRCRVA